MPDSDSPQPGRRLVPNVSYILALGAHPRSHASYAVCSLPTLEKRVANLARARRRLDLEPDRVIHCALPDRNPLGYVWSDPTGTGKPATCADLGRLWRAQLGQGLTVTTAGSDGRAHGRAALATFAEMPQLLAALTLRIQVEDALPAIAVENLAEDISIARRLSTVPAVGPRGEELPRTVFQIQIVHTRQSTRTAHDTAWSMLFHAGLTRRERSTILDDPTRLVFEQRTRDEPTLAAPGYGIGICGELFVVHDDGVKIEELRTGANRRDPRTADSHVSRPSDKDP